jgi:hypothetical protein
MAVQSKTLAVVGSELGVVVVLAAEKDLEPWLLLYQSQ